MSHTKQTENYKYFFSSILSKSNNIFHVLRKSMKTVNLYKLYILNVMQLFWFEKVHIFVWSTSQ